MSDEMSITILGVKIPISEDKISITKLNYNKDNPRIHSILHGNSQVGQGQDMQQGIYDTMLKQSSVKNIKKDIYDNGGLLEPILIRKDKDEVVEGNSRLTVYLYWHKKNPQDERWQKIQCRVVTELTDEQQDWYLNKIHREGKTEWSAYEKAHYIYRRYEQGLSMEDIKKRFNITEKEVQKCCRAIELMASNNDNKQGNFSYYNDALVRNPDINEAISKDDKLKSRVLEEIKNNTLGMKALSFRDKFKVIVKNPRQLKKFSDGKINLDDAYEAVKTNTPESKLRLAKAKMEDVTKSDISRLDVPDLNKLSLTVKNLKKQIERIEKMIEEQKK